MSSFIKNYGDRCREEGRKEGEKDGEKKGEKKGRLATLREIVERMLRKGFSMEEVSSAVELTPEEIAKIHNGMPTVG